MNKELPTARYWFAPEGFAIRVGGEPSGNRRRHAIRLLTDGRCSFESHQKGDFKVIDNLITLGYESRCSCVAVREAFQDSSKVLKQSNEIVRYLDFKNNLSSTYIDEMAVLHEWWILCQIFRTENRRVRRFFRRHEKEVKRLQKEVAEARPHESVEILQRWLPKIFSLAGVQSVASLVLDLNVLFYRGKVEVVQNQRGLTISDAELRHPLVLRAVLEHALRWAYARLFRTAALERELKIAEEMSGLSPDVLEDAASMEESGVVSITDVDAALEKSTQGQFSSSRSRRYLDKTYILRMDVDKLQDFQVLSILRLWKMVAKYLGQKQRERKEVEVSHAES